MIVYAYCYNEIKKLEDIPTSNGLLDNVYKEKNKFYIEVSTPFSISINKMYLSQDFFYDFDSLKKVIEDSKNYFTIVEKNYLELLKEFYDNYEKGFIKFHF